MQDMEGCCEGDYFPPTDFRVDVDSVRSFNAARVMTTALPNFQRLSISSLSRRHVGRRRKCKYKYSDGENPDKVLAQRTANYTYTTYDINIMSNFTKLRSLSIDKANLNGSTLPSSTSNFFNN